MKHFLAETDLTQPQLATLLERARQLKLGRGRADPQPLRGQSWGMLFAKSSTRTRVSFEVGLAELGGRAVYLEQRQLQIDRGESIADTARVLSRYLHGLVIRCHGHEVVEGFARHGSIPVVNALTDLLHPCQSSSDAFTLAERWAQPGQPLIEALAGRTLAYLGDCSSNMAHSLILMSALTGMRIQLAGPAEYGPQPEVDRLLAAVGLPRDYRFTTTAAEAAEGADALYTDVWVSMGQESEAACRRERMRPYTVDAGLLARARPGALFLHCLPAHPGEEVTAEVIEGPASVVFDQAENRLHVQKAILEALTAGRRMPSEG